MQQNDNNLIKKLAVIIGVLSIQTLCLSVTQAKLPQRVKGILEKKKVIAVISNCINDMEDKN
ncbi:MAG: hypothetical protein RR420_01020 [Anaerovoracaceae bacterium]